MPPAVAVAGIGAAGTLLGGAMQARSANRAARYQRDSQREALDYQRQRQAEEDRRYQQRWDAYSRDREAWNAKYGFGSSGGGSAPAGGGGGAPAAAGVTIGDLMAAQPTGEEKATAPEGTAPETLGDWTDWRRYGTNS